MLRDLARIRPARTRRASSWDRSGRNQDCWTIAPGEGRVLADLRGPGCVTHIWMTQSQHYRECLLQISYDGAKRPSVLVPLGDFFCLGHGIVNSFQSLLFSASTQSNYQFNKGCALNCYALMPFAERAVVTLINESRETHGQYFYIDYELYDDPLPPGTGYFHAEFRRENPFGGWGPEIPPNAPEANVANKGRAAWDNNYVILDTRGRGHYIGCNLSVANFQGTWWGEGDDMIWVDGYKWPPDLHGTGSEDYFNQAWGMQPNAFLRNGSSIFEGHSINVGPSELWKGTAGGYQTSYVFHVENPVRFEKEIKVTIEHGHANHLANEVSSVAYWYAERPTPVCKVPPVGKRMPALRDSLGNWLVSKRNQTAPRRIKPDPEMLRMKKRWKRQHP